MSFNDEHHNDPTLVMVGGFLGAGKTTTILALARELERRGRRFGIVTNDQGSDLVDTHYLRAQGLVVHEVTGGCFCCNFTQFADAVSTYGDQADVVLAEPVGSCTDLVATLFRPLRAQQMARFSLAPLSVVVDPRRARRFLARQGSAEINYLFEKQCDEADLLLLNKIDSLSPVDIDELAAGLTDAFPGRRIVRIAAAVGDGIPTLLDEIAAAPHRDAPLDISYDRYGASEAALGWLNLQARIESASALDPNELATGILARLAATSIEHRWEVAHAKVYLVGGLEHAKASLVSASAEGSAEGGTAEGRGGHGDVNQAALIAAGVLRLDERINARPERIEIVLNARIAAPPPDLERAAREAIDRATSGAAVVGRASSFSPAYPTPTHRMRA